MIKAYPKIFSLGTDFIKDIFQGEVEITEKVDGSQFVFGRVNGEIYTRSKGAVIYKENVQKMFQEAVDYVYDNEQWVEEGTVYYCEYLKNEKHNSLHYDRIPKNHLALYGASTIGGTFTSDYRSLQNIADSLEIDVVPLIYRGVIDDPKKVFSLIEEKSYLGGADMEGCVVKNYNKPFLLGGQPISVMAGKYVSEKFKEVHKTKWNKENTSKGKFDVFKSGFCTEARWHKAIQHLNEEGKLIGDPKDIGLLMKEIQKDVLEEEKNNITDFLWREFSKEIARTSVKGFPEFYKQYLVTRQE